MAQKTVIEALREIGVSLPGGITPGRWRGCRCPYAACEGKKARAFRVKIESDYVGYVCMRCGQKGRVWLTSRDAERGAYGLSGSKENPEKRKADWLPDYNGPPR